MTYPRALTIASAAVLAGFSLLAIIMIATEATWALPVAALASTLWLAAIFVCTVWTARSARRAILLVERLTKELSRLRRTQDLDSKQIASSLEELFLRLDSIGTKSDAAARALRGGPGGLRHQLRHEVSRDMAAHLALHVLVPLAGAPMPLTSYSALPRTVVELVQLVRELPREGLVVELGSGASTVWMALAAKQSNRGIRIISLEHSEDWAEQARRSIRANRVEEHVELRVADLQERASHQGPWYDVASIQDISDVAVLFIDGPPGSGSKEARMPSLEFFASRMAPNCVVVVDDTDRADEKKLADAWQRELSQSGDVQVITLERTIILTRRVPAQ